MRRREIFEDLLDQMETDDIRTQQKDLTADEDLPRGRFFISVNCFIDNICTV